MKEWAEFFHKGNCDKCVPCREGIYRILKMMESERIDKKILDDLFFAMEESSFCSLGRSIPETFRGAINKLLKFTP
jgi:NADH:ubiquinone oxidoreductase subunit F (NADH-binding)